MIRFLSDNFKDELSYYSGLIGREPNLSQIKEMSEFAFLLIDILENSKLSPEDYVLLSRFINNIASEAYVVEKIFYYHSLYKMPQEYYNCDSESVGRATYKANIDINVMRLQMKLGMVNGSSEDRYYFTRGESGLIRATENLLNHCDDIWLLIPALYTIINYLQSMIEYLESDSKLYEKSARSLAEKCVALIIRFIDKEEMKNHLEENLQLSLFLHSTIKRYEEFFNIEFNYIDKEIEHFSEYNNVTKKIWAYHSLSSIDISILNEFFIEDFCNLFVNKYDSLKRIEKTILLRVCLKYLSSLGEVDLTDIRIPVSEKFENKNWFRLSDYFNGYDNISTVTITDEDRKEVLEYNDEILREKVSKTIINIDKEIIEREMKKPHGVFEISDMELPIRTLRCEKTYHLCMPFKSGREINGKVKEDVSYQVYRPFANFGDKAIVVFISPCEGTEPFHNAMKRAVSNLNWTIYTLMGDSLIKLLKHNNLI